MWVQSRQNEVWFDASSLFLHSSLCLAFRRPRAALNEALVCARLLHTRTSLTQHCRVPGAQVEYARLWTPGLLVLLQAHPFLRRRDHPEHTPPCPRTALWIHRSQNCPQMASSLEVDSTGLYAWGSQGPGVWGYLTELGRTSRVLAKSRCQCRTGEAGGRETGTGYRLQPSLAQDTH